MNDDKESPQEYPCTEFICGSGVLKSMKELSVKTISPDTKNIPFYYPEVSDNGHLNFVWNDEDGVVLATEEATVGNWLNLLTEHVAETIEFHSPQSDEFTPFEGLGELLANDWWSYATSTTSSAMMLVHGSMFAIEQCLLPIEKRKLDDMRHTWFEFGLNQPKLHDVWEYGGSPRGGWFWLDGDSPHKVSASYFSTRQGQFDFAVSSAEGLRKYLAALVIYYKMKLSDLLNDYPNVKDHIVLRDLYPTNDKLKQWLDRPVVWDEVD